MQSKNFVVCDAEPEYARQFVQAVSTHRDLGVQVHLFQKLEQVENFANQRAVHILLLGEECPEERRERIEAKERFVLVKGEERELLPGETGIYKYQSADKILGRILEKAAQQEGVVRRGTHIGGGELIGIYSPIHRIGKTRFAMELGAEKVKEGPVLYLNLEEYSGGSFYFPENAKYNLGDLLYYIRQEKGNFGLRLSTMAGRIGEMDYIAPMPVIQDLRAVEGEEWLNLFGEILSNCIYRTVILDLGDGVSGLYQILRACNTVYTPYLDAPVSRAKLCQYVENLRQTGFEDVLEHTIQKKVSGRAGESV